MSPVRPCLLILICSVLSGLGDGSQAEGTEITLTTIEVTSTSISLNITCSTDQCQDSVVPYIFACTQTINRSYREPKCLYGTGVMTFSKLEPFTQHEFIVYRRKALYWNVLETFNVTTKKSDSSSVPNDSYSVPTANNSQSEAGEDMDMAPVSRMFLRQLLKETITPVIKELSDMKADIQHIGRRVESVEQRQTMILADIKALVHRLHTQESHINNASSLAIEDRVGT